MAGAVIALRFSGGLGLMGRVVQAATWSWASHVDIELDGGRWLLGAVPGRGVCVRDPRDEAPSRVERYRVPMFDHQAAQVTAHAKMQVGTPYDWAGVLGWGLHRNWQDGRAWFCSELVAWAFAQAGVPLLRAADASRISPRDLLLSPLLEPLDKYECRRCTHPCKVHPPVGYCLLGHRAP